MRHITVPMFRYGEADFDKDYLNWGLHDRDTQTDESKSILRIINSKTPLRILDLACGIGTHAIHFAKQGHKVTAVDLSATFIEEAAKQAIQEGVDVSFEVGDIKKLGYSGCFDLVTWVEKSFFDDEIVTAIHRYLAEDGCFIMDSRNPEHPKTKRLCSNWRTWRQENGVFYLESHETDEPSSVRRNVWIEIDTKNGITTEKSDIVQLNNMDKIEMLLAGGFSHAEYRTMAGDAFPGGENPYWLWAVVHK